MLKIENGRARNIEVEFGRGGRFVKASERIRFESEKRAPVHTWVEQVPAVRQAGVRAAGRHLSPPPV
jgi:hypothetical protein